jgi:hypothetical protein
VKATSGNCQVRCDLWSTASRQFRIATAPDVAGNDADRMASPAAKKSPFSLRVCWTLTRSLSAKPARSRAVLPNRGDDGTNDRIVSEVLRTNELQVWFLSEHLVDLPLGRQRKPPQPRPVRNIGLLHTAKFGRTELKC